MRAVLDLTEDVFNDIFGQYRLTDDECFSARFIIYRLHHPNTDFEPVSPRINYPITEATQLSLTHQFLTYNGLLRESRKMISNRLYDVLRFLHSNGMSGALNVPNTNNEFHIYGIAILNNQLKIMLVDDAEFTRYDSKSTLYFAQELI